MSEHDLVKETAETKADELLGMRPILAPAFQSLGLRGARYNGKLSLQFLRTDEVGTGFALSAGSAAAEQFLGQHPKFTSDLFSQSGVDPDVATAGLFAYNTWRSTPEARQAVVAAWAWAFSGGL